MDDDDEFPIKKMKDRKIDLENKLASAGMFSGQSKANNISDIERVSQANKEKMRIALEEADSVCSSSTPPIGGLSNLRQLAKRFSSIDSQGQSPILKAPPIYDITDSRIKNTREVEPPISALQNKPITKYYNGWLILIMYF